MGRRLRTTYAGLRGHVRSPTPEVVDPGLSRRRSRVRPRAGCAPRLAGVPFQSSPRKGGDGRLTAALDPHDQGPQDACGVFGVWAPGEDVAKLTYFGLYAL